MYKLIITLDLSIISCYNNISYITNVIFVEEREMPPKAKITKEDIIAASVDIVRENGADALNARSVAKKLNCSTQPIFSNFKSMEELRYDVLLYSVEVFRRYQKDAIKCGEYQAYKAVGMGYIKFAKEERELYKLLFMRDRRDEVFENPVNLDFDNAASMVMERTGLSRDEAMLFHLEMWVFVHGIATVLATSYLELDYDTISRMLTDQFVGLEARFIKEK